MNLDTRLADEDDASSVHALVTEYWQQHEWMRREGVLLYRPTVSDIRSLVHDVGILLLCDDVTIVGYSILMTPDVAFREHVLQPLVQSSAKDRHEGHFCHLGVIAQRYVRDEYCIDTGLEQLAEAEVLTFREVRQRFTRDVCPTLLNGIPRLDTAGLAVALQNFGFTVVGQYAQQTGAQCHALEKHI